MQQLAPFLADLAGLGLTFLLLPSLYRRFQLLSFVNSLLLGAIFGLFCLAVYGIKKLRPALSGPKPLPRRPLAGLGVLFAFFITLAITYVVGFLDSVVDLDRGLLDEPSATMYLLLTPASWFGLALIYMLLLSAPIEVSVRPHSGRYVAVTLLALSGVNLMAVASTAVLQALRARFQPGAPYLSAGLTLSLFLLLFAPPRLLYLVKQRHPLSAVPSFLLLLVYLAWLTVA